MRFVVAASLCRGASAALRPATATPTTAGRLCRGYNPAHVIHALYYLARFRVVVRKLKIAPSGAIPLSHSEIVLIDRL